MVRYHEEEDDKYKTITRDDAEQKGRASGRSYRERTGEREQGTAKDKKGETKERRGA